MPRPRKLFIHNTVVSVVTRVQEGLPFVSTPYMKLIIQSALAGAQALYRVRLVAFLVMGNHIHFIFVVENPADIPRFMGYFKTETAIAINRLLGRRQRSVWVSGYGSPTVLDAEKTINELVYLYTNPQSARLVNTIEEYPQLSSWNEFLSGKSSSISIPSYRRDAVPALSGEQTTAESERVYQEILSKSKHQKVLHIEPFAWLGCFEETAGMTPSQAIELIEKKVRAKEQDLQRRSEPNVLGREALLSQDIRTPHTPKKWGKKMICLASDKFKRVTFLRWYYDQKRKIERAMEDFKLKLIPPKLPPGFFLPGGGLTASLLPFVFHF